MDDEEALNGDGKVWKGDWETLERIWGAFKSNGKALEGRLEGVEEDFIELKIDI